MVAPWSPRGCEKITDWPTPIQTSYFIGPYNLHYLLFSGIAALLCHHPYCFCSQSQTLFGIGAGRPKITSVTRCLFRLENTFDFTGGRSGGGGGWCRCFKHFLEYTYFSRLVEVILRILQPLLCCFFHQDLFILFFNLLSFYPITRFLVTPLLVTALLCLVTPQKMNLFSYFQYWLLSLNRR